MTAHSERWSVRRCAGVIAAASALFWLAALIALGVALWPVAS